MRKHNSPIKGTDQPQRMNARQENEGDKDAFDKDRTNSEWGPGVYGNQRSYGRGRGKGARGQRRGR